MTVTCEQDLTWRSVDISTSCTKLLLGDLVSWTDLEVCTVVLLSYLALKEQCI